MYSRSQLGKQKRGGAAATGKRRKAAPVKAKKASNTMRVKVKGKKMKRDATVTKLLHRNIESLMAAKVIKNQGGFKLRDLRQVGKAQVAVEERTTKKKKKRTKEDAMELAIQNASSRVEASNRRR